MGEAVAGVAVGGEVVGGKRGRPSWSVPTFRGATGGASLLREAALNILTTGPLESVNRSRIGTQSLRARLGGGH